MVHADDFKPAVGHRFTFRARPFRALIDGTVRCEVLELEQRTMVWSSSAATFDTTVTFTEQTKETRAADTPGRLRRPPPI